MTARAIRTTCPYCGVGCGVLAQRARRTGTFEIARRPGASRQPRQAVLQRLGARRNARPARPAAVSPHARRAHDLGRSARSRCRGLPPHHRSRTGPSAVAFYVSGQLLTEDYYVANKLMKGYIGTANIDTNSRLCMSSAVAGHKRAFGEDLVPVCYDDLELADLIVLVGSNTAWCHPILFQRIAAARQAAAGHEDRRHRSAPHGDLRDRRPAPAGARRHRRVAVQRAARVPAPARHGRRRQFVARSTQRSRSMRSRVAQRHGR